MASKAREAFDKNAQDIARLMELHTDEGGDKPGRRFGLEVLNKSAIVLITAIWEAYCEDLASEALEHFVTHATDASVLSKEIKQIIAKELAKDPNQLAIWTLAGDGWRSVMRQRLDKLKEQRNWSLNTPKSAQIDDLFLKTVGLGEVSKAWYWQKMSSSAAGAKLDQFVELRGAIAHRGQAAQNCHKSQVMAYFSHVSLLVGKTEKAVNSFVRAGTKKPLW